MLQLQNLRVEIDGREVLTDINLDIKDGETFILFGPNGSGKTTLLMTIMGLGYGRVTGGRIIFKGQDITDMPAYERARLGLGMSFQRPPTIKGLKTRQLVQLCARDKEVDIDALAVSLNLSRFMDRDINDGFSGGEIKRSELLQLLAQGPDMVLFDEPESGVDLENMALIGRMANRLLTNHDHADDNRTQLQKMAERRTSGLVITHTGYILDYINADRSRVLYNGRLCCEGNPREMLEHIRTFGYQECVRCLGGNLEEA